MPELQRYSQEHARIFNITMEPVNLSMNIQSLKVTEKTIYNQ